MVAAHGAGQGGERHAGGERVARRPARDLRPHQPGQQRVARAEPVDDLDVVAARLDRAVLRGPRRGAAVAERHDDQLGARRDLPPQGGRELAVGRIDAEHGTRVGRGADDDLRLRGKPPQHGSSALDRPEPGAVVDVEVAPRPELAGVLEEALGDRGPVRLEGRRDA